MNRHPDRKQFFEVLRSAPLLLPPELMAHLRDCSECAAEIARLAIEEAVAIELRRKIYICPGCRKVAEESETELCRHCGAVFSVKDLQVLSLLASSGHSRVYLAQDSAGRSIALKEIVFAQVPSAETLEAFDREARILKQLDHPRVPKYISNFQIGEGVNTRLYLAQEHVAGRSLLAVLETHRFTESEAREIAKQVLCILVYLQKLSPPVFHRDIKPANLMWNEKEEISLVDFGSSRDLGATQGATLVGTFGYMPSEQLGGIVDSTTDLYGLGTTIIHLLSRRPPWSYHGKRIGKKEMNVSGPFLTFVRKLTEEKASSRYQSAETALKYLSNMRQKSVAINQGAKASVFAAIAVLVVGAGISLTRISSHLDGAGITSRAIAHLPLNGDAKDESGHGFDGTITRAEPTEDRFGRPGGALKLLGDGQIAVGKFIGYEWGEKISVSIWFNRSGGWNEYQGIVNTGYHTEGSWEIRMGREEGGTMIGGGVVTLSSPTTWEYFEQNRPALIQASKNAWHHVVLVYDGRTVEFYLDAKRKWSSKRDIGPIISRGLPLIIGNNGKGGEFFYGDVDDLLVFNEALSEQEVYEIYSGKKD